MAGKKTNKQRKRELQRRKTMQKPETQADLCQYGNSLKRGQKW